MDELKEEGVRSIVNLRLDNEENQPLRPKEEGEMVAKLGMEYLHLPVSSRDANSAQVEQFCQKLEELPKPVFVHCQGGTRAGAFCLMHLGRKAGWDTKQALERGEKAGFQCESAALLALIKDALKK